MHAAIMLHKAYRLSEQVPWTAVGFHGTASGDHMRDMAFGEVDLSLIAERV